jgi:hypothetical protein
LPRAGAFSRRLRAEMTTGSAGVLKRARNLSLRSSGRTRIRTSDLSLIRAAL